MKLTQKIGKDNNMNGEGDTVQWSSETNWVTTHGSIGDIITVESSDCPIDESVLEIASPKSPVVLKPCRSDAGPCEIKISFDQKYDISQIYVRSTARTYEVYYATAPNGSNEYLCTVRCCGAERDGNLLQATCIVDVPGGNGDCLLGELTEETISDGGSAVASEDGWVKIKSPEVGRRLPDMVNTGGMKNIQDLYEATAQISNVDPCSSLTIRLLSLQDKGCTYVDEVYIFVDPVEPTDSGNEAVLPETSTQNSLMAMFLPSLLQLSKSGASRVGDKSDHNEVYKESEVETGSRGIGESNVGLDKNQVYQLSANLEELDKMERRIDETDVGMQKKCIQHQHVNSKEHEKDTGDSKLLEQPHQIQEHSELIRDKNLSMGNLERMLDQLISRVSRVEDICMRFDEKMLKPIQSIEARLQQVENQLEKLARSSLHSSLPHCTRFSAPAFPCSESNSSSFYNEQTADGQPCGASEHEKKESLCDNHNDHGTRFSAPAFSCSESNSSSFYNEQTTDGQPCGASEHEKKESLCDDHRPELSGGANLCPSLIIRAPEFSYSEEDEDLKPSNCSSLIGQNKRSSIDDALAAALNGFSSSTMIQAISGLPSKQDEENRHHELAESCQIEAQENHGTGDGHGEAPAKAFDCTADEIGGRDHSNYTQISSDEAFSFIENEEKDDGDEMVPSSIQNQGSFKSGDVCAFGSDKSAHMIDSVSNGDSRAYNGNGHNINESSESEVYTTHGSFQGNISYDPLETGNDSMPDSIKNSMEGSGHQIYDKDAASEQVLEHRSESASDVLGTAERCLPHSNSKSSDSSIATLLDFQFPILEVKFTPDVRCSFKSPLDALLDGSTEPNSEAPPVHDCAIMDSNEATPADLATNLEGISGNHCSGSTPVHDEHLVDIGDSSADVAANLEGISGNHCGGSTPPVHDELLVDIGDSTTDVAENMEGISGSPSTLEMNVSLI